MSLTQIIGRSRAGVVTDLPLLLDPSLALWGRRTEWKSVRHSGRCV